jgi:hypothetical protein
MARGLDCPTRQRHATTITAVAHMIASSKALVRSLADMRGRKPRPARLKALTGNPGKRPLNGNEPQAEPEIPECPAELGPLAHKEWDRLAAQLAPLRLLTQLDRAALATY